MTGVRITHIGGPTAEGWKHFKEGREAIEREFALAPEDIRRRIRWLPIGAAVELAAFSE